MPSRPQDALRTFVALVPSETMRGALSGEAERLAHADRGVRVVPRANLHLTLAFLGATPPDAVPAIVEALARAVAGVEPVRLRPAGLSAFPSPTSPSVVFAALAPDTHPPLEALAARVGEALASTGRRPDRAERFHPHLTLARVDSSSPSLAMRNLLTAGTLQGTYIDDVITDVRLLSSESAPVPASLGLSAEASRTYRVLASLPLRAPPLQSASASPQERPSSAVSDVPPVADVPQVADVKSARSRAGSA